MPPVNLPASHPTNLAPAKPSPTATGRLAEQHAADYLAARGFAILDRNWRNRWCELDIVARRTGPDRHGTVHFIEVKYRRRAAWGSGFDHISYDKIQRLRRAALAWTQAHSYTGDYQIDIIAVSGEIDRPVIHYLANAVQ